MRACACGHPMVVRMLLRANASLEHKSDKGHSPIACATEHHACSREVRDYLTPIKDSAINTEFEARKTIKAINT
eukprot:2177322-Prymnesium_polylepis.1